MTQRAGMVKQVEAMQDVHAGGLDEQACADWTER